MASLTQKFTSHMQCMALYWLHIFLTRGYIIMLSLDLIVAKYVLDHYIIHYFEHFFMHVNCFFIIGISRYASFDLLLGFSCWVLVLGKLNCVIVLVLPNLWIANASSTFLGHACTQHRYSIDWIMLTHNCYI